MSELLPSNQIKRHSHRAINHMIKESGADTNLISDGYHTFGELYDHRIQLFIRTCWLESFIADNAAEDNPVWKSKFHSDGSTWPGWFVLGINKEPGKQITYHLPMSYWDECSVAETLDQAPEFDGHTSADVLQRLKYL
jgi:hypothetical protein